MATGHGNTPAAWTAVIIMLVGSTVACVGVVVADPLFFLLWVGIGIVAIGAIVGRVLSMMGLGAPQRLRMHEEPLTENAAERTARHAVERVEEAAHRTTNPAESG